VSAEREAAAVAERYARRRDPGRYSMLRADVWQTLQERQRAMLGLFAEAGLTDLAQCRLLEVGCGAGGNLLELLRVGFAPAHLSGVELLPERLALARALLPEAVALHGGDALDAAVPARLGPETKYGLGVIVRSATPVGPAWGHSGFFPGYQTELIYLPELGVSLAIQINTSAPRATGSRSLLRALLDIAAMTKPPAR